jgi:hypothetical protein
MAANNVLWIDGEDADSLMRKIYVEWDKLQRGPTKSHEKTKKTWWDCAEACPTLLSNFPIRDVIVGKKSSAAVR